VLLTLIAIAAVAYFVGTRIERAREAHTNFNGYKRRVASMRGVRWRETSRALVGIVALVVLLNVVAHLV
jgi:UDP-N-acetylmuramate-alanine ligase